MLKKILVSLFAICSIAAAQSGPSVSQVFKPGDTLRFVAKFDGKVELTSANLHFDLQGAVRPDQTGLSGGIDVAKFRKTSPQEIELSTAIPSNTATGTYKATMLYANHGPENHQYPLSGTLQITIEVRNDSAYQFPKLESVQPTH